ncbi:MAG TPA: ABC transporter substrate-binding protein [Acetobacteraceae bacterium]|nr:ABC transporter substrate-binding protein [Acetobacteraceae bacterium]
MPSRRMVLCFPAAVAGIAAPLLLSAYARSATDATQAGAFIKAAGQELSTLARRGGSEAARREGVQRFLDRVVDTESVARFCLGRYWRQATADQQRAYLGLFREVLLNIVFNRISEYGQDDVKVVTGRPEQRDEGIYVPTTVQRAGAEPARVTWVVRSDGQEQRIVDLVVEGASLRLTVRSDYAAFLMRHNNDVGALIEAMRQQIATPGRGVR